MRRLLTRAALTATLAAAAVLGSSALQPAAAAPGGSGPYPADYSTASSLPNHTVYRPSTLPSQRMPIVVWSNGACSADGTSAVNFLKEIASHGFLVISNGNPGGGGSSSSSWLTQSIDWAVAENSRPQSALYNRLDTSEIGAAGFSCGGLEAYAVSGDPRVTTTGIFSSGLLNDADDYQLRRLDHPIVYIIGGPSDIAYPNAVDDWGKLPTGLPAFMGNLNVGHGGTYAQPNGGEFGRAAQLWFRWQLKGDTTAGRAFVGQNCGLCGNGWTAQQPEEEPHARARAHPDTDTDAHSHSHADTDADFHADADADADPGHVRVQRDVHRVRPVARRLRRQRRGDRALRGHRVDRAADAAERRHGYPGVERGVAGSAGSVSVTNAAWNGRVAAGQSTSFGSRARAPGRAPR